MGEGNNNRPANQTRNDEGSGDAANTHTTGYNAQSHGASRRSRARKNNHGKNQTRTKTKFTGLNKDELEGKVICESSNTPLAQQFDELYDALLVYSGSRNGKVRKSLRMFAKQSKEDFDPPRPSESTYVNSDGEIDEDVKKVRFSAWEKAVESTYKTYQKYEDAMENAYNVVIGQLGAEIISSLKGLDNWEDIDDNSDVIGLMKELKVICYRDNSTKVDPAVDVFRKLKKLVNSRQHEPSKSTTEFVEETVNKGDVFTASGALIFSPEIAKYTLKNVMNQQYSYKEYLKLWGSDRTEDIKTKEKIDQCIMQVVVSRIIIEGSNDKANQALRIELEKDFAKGHDNYPNTTAKTTDLLNKYRVTSKHQQNRNGDRSSRNDNKQDRSARDKTGSDKEDEAMVNVMKGTEQDSRNNDDEEEEAIEKAHVCLMQGIEEDESDDDKEDEAFLFLSKSTVSCDIKTDWCTMEESKILTAHGTDTYSDYDEDDEHHPITTNEKDDTTNANNVYLFAQTQQTDISPNWLLLDSQASCNIISNPNLLNNIREHPDGRSVVITCNAGTMRTNLVGDMNGFGTVWFSNECIANILSLSMVSEMYRVTLDTRLDQAFHIHRGDGSTRRFHRAPCNLYINDIGATEEFVLINTVEGQKALYSNLDVRRASAARKLQSIIMYPSNRAFVKMIDNNLIKNCDSTRRDIMMAQDIFGPNTNIIKGKTVARATPHVREDILPVPPKILERYSDVCLSMDVYYINKCPFLRTVSRHLMFRTSIPLLNEKQSTLIKKIKAIVGQYQLRGFTVTQIHGDNQFTTLGPTLSNEMNIRYVPTARGAHEKFIERDNRTSKERCRCVVAGLPYERLTKRMIMELPPAVDFFLNYWCSSGGVSQTMPPRQIITGIQIDANKHCRFEFGEYILAHGDSNNTMQPRAIDALYLRPTGTPDGAFWVLNLETGQRSRRLQATAATLTNTIIRRVEELATAEGMPKGIEITDQRGVTIMDIDTETPEGVDDDSNASDDDFSQDDSSRDSEFTGYDSDITETNKVIDQDYVPGAVDDQDTDNHSDAERQERDAQGDEIMHDDNHRADAGHTRVTDQEDSGDDDEEETIIFTNDNDADSVDHIDISHPTSGEREDDTNSSIQERNDATQQGDGDTMANGGPRLRQRVNRLNAKTFEQAVHHRNFFCRGYSAAVRSIESKHNEYCMVAAAVENYNNLDASPVTPQYGVNKGLSLFQKEGSEAILKELRQLHNMNVITPKHPSEMNREDIQRALPYLMFLKRKRCGKVKGRGCADGRGQREFISRDEASSPTASLYAILLTAVVDAIENRFVATTDIPGAFLQTDMPKDEVVHIKIVGAMAELLESIDPELYSRCVVTTRKGKKIIYAKANKAIYGTLKAALLFWKKLKGKLEEWGFVQNPYDPCTMNKIINGRQATIVWHVDDLKISHCEESVVRGILNDLDSEFGSVSSLSTTTGKVHDYLGMTIDYTEVGKVRLTMFDYLQDIIASLPGELVNGRTVNTPAAEHLFEVNENAQKLDKQRAERFHKYVAKLLFAAKRARPDIQTAIAFLCTRVKEPDVDDEKKLIRVLGYIKETLFLPLTLGWDKSGNIYWYVDASFAVHNNMRSHTGAVMTFGQGAVVSISTKQKLNTKSSTEAELVGVDDAMPFNIWCMYFLKEQGYHANGVDKPHKSNVKYIGHQNILYQDNTSSIKLETNGKSSSTKRTRHINIRYFLVTDKVKRGEISSIEYCPTEEMIADYLTKPLQGTLFRKFRNAIMGCTDAEYLKHKLAFEKALANQQR